jgi:type IV secretion system protein VirB11
MIQPYLASQQNQLHAKMTLHQAAPQEVETELTGVYLRTYLKPFEVFLNQPDITEILVNQPGEVWVERIGSTAMERHLVPDLDSTLLQRLSWQIARSGHQGINRENPLLGATLPTGERVQIIAPPATRRHVALAIRRHVMVDLSLEAYAQKGALSKVRRTQAGVRDASDQALDHMLAQGNTLGFLKAAVKARKTLLISGGTSTGKTTFLNALLKEISADERIITVEDAAEVQVSQPNHVGLLAVKGNQGEARVSVDDLLQASLRLRPDRIIVGEIRGREAATFLRAINTGHPGSFTTVHADSPQGALEQIALMVLQAGLGLTRLETIAYVRSQVDIIIQLGREAGIRGVREILFEPKI